MSSPLNDFQLDAQDVIAELISTDPGKMLWENAQLKVLAMRQNNIMVNMQNELNALKAEKEAQQAGETNPDA